MARAFTLIELLVVVTIIVVLLALLVPAMDKAIYKTELVVCSANLKGIAAGITLYASQNNRWYPTRFAGGGVPGQPHLMDQNAGTGWSNRRPIQPYVSIKAFLDPLTPAIDYEVLDGADIYVPYNMWWSYRYGPPPPGSPKIRNTKMGSPFKWMNVGEKEYEFYLLVGDYDETWDGGAWSNHADRDGLMWHPEEENAQNLFSSNQRIFISRWYNAAGVRGPLDLNFAYQDGSVGQLYDLEAQDDERTIKTPQVSNADALQRYTRLPIPIQ